MVLYRKRSQLSTPKPSTVAMRLPDCAWIHPSFGVESWGETGKNGSSQLLMEHMELGRHMDNWLVVEPYPSGKYEFVNWDDYIWLFQIYGKIKHVPNHQPDLFCNSHLLESHDTEQRKDDPCCHCFSFARVRNSSAGWWLSHPSEKYESHWDIISNV